MSCLSVSGAVHVFPTVGYSKVLWESGNTTLVMPVMVIQGPSQVICGLSRKMPLFLGGSRSGLYADSYEGNVRA